MKKIGIVLLLAVFSVLAGQRMEAQELYKVVDLTTIEPIACPCGFAQRAFVDDPDQIASIHIVDIKKDSEVHYHKKQTEIYFILEGEGHMELDGKLIPVKPYTTILIKPGCRHRAVGDLKIINMVIPAFDTEDEWFD